eukprot:RCo048824
MWDCSQSQVTASLSNAHRKPAAEIPIRRDAQYSRKSTPTSTESTLEVAGVSATPSNAGRFPKLFGQDGSCKGGRSRSRLRGGGCGGARAENENALRASSVTLRTSSEEARKGSGRRAWPELASPEDADALRASSVALRVSSVALRVSSVALRVSSVALRASSVEAREGSGRRAW